MHKSFAMLQKLKQKRYYNRQGYFLKPIEQGDTVRIHLPGHVTLTHKVCKARVGPRSYEIQVGGTLYQWNRSQIIRPKNKQAQTYHCQFLHKKIEKVVLTIHHNKWIQIQSHRIHWVHQELRVQQFSIDQIEPEAAYSRWMGDYVPTWQYFDSSTFVSFSIL